MFSADTGSLHLLASLSHLTTLWLGITKQSLSEIWVTWLTVLNTPHLLWISIYLSIYLYICGQELSRRQAMYGKSDSKTCSLTEAKHKVFREEGSSRIKCLHTILKETCEQNETFSLVHTQSWINEYWDYIREEKKLCILPTNYEIKGFQELGI